MLPPGGRRAAHGTSAGRAGGGGGRGPAGGPAAMAARRDAVRDLVTRSCTAGGGQHCVKVLAGRCYRGLHSSTFSLSLYQRAWPVLRRSTSRALLPLGAQGGSGLHTAGRGQYCVHVLARALPPPERYRSERRRRRRLGGK